MRWLPSPEQVTYLASIGIAKPNSPTSSIRSTPPAIRPRRRDGRLVMCLVAVGVVAAFVFLAFYFR